KTADRSNLACPYSSKIDLKRERQSLHRKRSPFRNLNRRSEPVGSLLVSVDSSASLLPALRALSSVTFQQEGLLIVSVPAEFWLSRCTQHWEMTLTEGNQL
ncbi:MAG: hypothetical protein IKT57_03025, partial [Clostridia bacterium]|nr:hypothetical protein [Clostridia bacterium]